MYRSHTPKMPEWEDSASVAIAAQHIHLVAHTMGYACKWTSGEVLRHEAVRQHVGLQAPSKLLGFLYIGRPLAGETPVGRRTPVENFTTWF
jgi:nitroreductase